MDDVISVLSVIFFASPLILGFVVFGGFWFRDHFYEKPFYEDYED